MRKSTPAKSDSPAPKAEPADAPVPVAAPDAAVILRKPELIERVMALSGMKKRDVKPVVEATLAALGDALSNDETLNLQPLGKVMVNRRKLSDNGEVMFTRIRRSKKSIEPPAQEGLAEPSE